MLSYVLVGLVTVWLGVRLTKKMHYGLIMTIGVVVCGFLVEFVGGYLLATYVGNYFPQTAWASRTEVIRPTLFMDNDAPVATCMWRHSSRYQDTNYSYFTREKGSRTLVNHAFQVAIEPTIVTGEPTKGCAVKKIYSERQFSAKYAWVGWIGEAGSERYILYEFDVPEGAIAEGYAAEQ